MVKCELCSNSDGKTVKQCTNCETCFCSECGDVVRDLCEDCLAYNELNDCLDELEDL